MRKILLMEDDQGLGEMLSQRLSQDYELKWARSIKEAKSALEKESPFDLLILDVGLPDGLGFDLVHFPFKGVKPPIIFLTARSDAESRLKGYELGAEEFIPKPFHLKELLLRLKHVLEVHSNEGRLELKDVIVDFNQMSVKRADAAIEYPPATDLRVLKYLVDASPKPVSRDEIIDHVWGIDKNPSHRTIDNTIVRIKKVLGPAAEDQLRSVRGIGYQWVKDSEKEKLVNTLFQNALQRKVQPVPPIWFMRQAGRYHSHYQNLRKKYSFVELCKIPEVAAEVAFGPVNEFDFDVAILFSDILFPLEGFGMGLEYTDKGPRLGFQLDADNIKKLKSVDEAKESLEFQFKAMQATRARIASNKSLIGFVGGPWTLFVYACEGSHTGSLAKTKSLIHLWPAFQEKIQALLLWNIKGQLDAGAEVVMIFDTAAGEADAAFFNEYLKPVLASLVNAFPGKVGYYSKGTQKHFFGTDFVNLPWAGRGVDHRCNLSDELRESKKGFIQGNFDQACLHMPTPDFRKHMNKYISEVKKLSLEERAGWVSGLGHGVLPLTPESHVKEFVNTIRREFS